MINTSMTQGDRLRRARRDAGLSSRDLAERLDISPATVSRYENDRMPAPKLVLYGYAAETSGSRETSRTLHWLETGYLDVDDATIAREPAEIFWLTPRYQDDQLSFEIFDRPSYFDDQLELQLDEAA